MFLMYPIKVYDYFRERVQPPSQDKSFVFKTKILKGTNSRNVLKVVEPMK